MTKPDTSTSDPMDKLITVRTAVQFASVLLGVFAVCAHIANLYGVPILHPLIDGIFLISSIGFYIMTKVGL